MKSGSILSYMAALAAAASAQTTAYDDFERAALGPNWTITTGPNAVVAIINGSDLGMSSGPATTLGGAGSEWTAGNVPGADQFSEAGISSDKPDSMLCQVYVRHRTGDNARYGFHWNNAFGGRWEIKYDGVPSAQTRIVDSRVGPAPRPGDTIRIEAVGRLLTGKLNGAILLSATDTAADAIVTTGRPGLVFRYTVTFPNAYPVSVFEWWRGGDFTPTRIVAPFPKTGFRKRQDALFVNALGRAFGKSRPGGKAVQIQIGRKP